MQKFGFCRMTSLLFWYPRSWCQYVMLWLFWMFDKSVLEWTVLHWTREQLIPVCLQLPGSQKSGRWRSTHSVGDHNVARSWHTRAWRWHLPCVFFSPAPPCCLLPLTPSPLPLQEARATRQVIFLQVPRCGFLLAGGVLHRIAERFNIVREQLVSILSVLYNGACFKPP